MKNHYVFILMLGTLFFSCAKQENSLTTLPIKGFRDTIHVQGRHTGIKDPEIGGLKIFDSIAFFSLYSHSQYGYRAYNLNTFKQMGNIIQKGRGPKEFTSPQLLSQPPERTNGEIKVWIKDFPTKISLVNITQTLYTGKTIVEKEYNFVRPGKANMLYQSNIPYIIEDGIFLMNLSQERSRNSDNPNPEPVYIIYAYTEDRSIDTLRFNYNFGIYSYMDKTNSRIVSTSPVEDIISIYDFKAKHETILYHTIKKPEEVYKVTAPKFEIPDYAYYGCEIHNNLIICAYYKNIKMASRNPGGNYYIHIFDLDGRPLYCLVLNEHLSTFSFDERNFILYGLDKEGNMYAYSLQKILKKKRNAERE